MFADLKNAWLTGGALGAGTYAVSAGSAIYSNYLSLSDGQTLTCAIINMGQANATDSVTFGLQESASSIGTFTPITDANASITLFGSTSIGVITGQRQYEYCRVAIQGSNTDTISCGITVHDVRTQMPHGASGSTRWPAVTTAIQ